MTSLSPGFLGRGVTQVFGSLRLTLVKSLRHPPGGDRDELVWSDRAQKGSSGTGEGCRRNSARGHPYSTPSSYAA